ncbi:HNH endonuclease signature motif containing protein [Specibacter cremeus]|uniref:HNH endonuclease signature motif containing protein n=1 Tax=Specibacter cremeus TaxID=1629051 RepID=UPI0013DDE970|nr:HNH endonuclease signature motif containing protein [Specibacter cremeus]
MDTEQAAPDHAGARTTRGATDGRLRRLLDLAYTATRPPHGTPGPGRAGESGPEFLGPVALGLDRVPDPELVTLARHTEAVAHALAAVQVQLAAELAARAGAGRYDGAGSPTPAVFVAHTLLASSAETGRRLKVAAAVLPHTDPLTHAGRPAAHPLLARAFFTGRLSLETAALIADYAHRATVLITEPDDDGQEPAGVSAEQAARVEEVLTDLADRHPPESVRQCAVRALAHLDPDGQTPTEGELRAKEGLHFGRPRRGLVSIRGHLTVADFELFLATTGTATNPHPTGAPTTPGTGTGDGTGTGTGASGAGTSGNAGGNTGTSGNAGGNTGTAGAPLPGQQPLWDTDAPGRAGGTGGSPGAGPGADSGTDAPDDADADGAHPGTDTGSATDRFFADECGLFDAAQPGQGPGNPVLRDERTRAQKLLHRLLDCLRLAAATDTLPDNGGLRPQLHVTVALEDLRRGLGTARVPYSGEIPVDQIRQAACDAQIIPIVMNGKGAVLDQGRRQRLVTPDIRRALYARDGGCAFPDCDRPPQWAEAHHIIPWSEGGPTSVANCCLVCSWHHHLLHRTDWTVTMINGTPWFTAPPIKDPLQHPLQNLYQHPPDI